MLFTNGAFKAKPVGKAGAPVTGTMIGNEGEERFAITFQLLEGPEVGKTITFYGGFKGKGSEFTLKVIQTCGWDPQKVKDFTTAELSKEVVLVLEDETYTNKQGEETKATKVKYVNSASAAPDFSKNATPPARAKALAAQLAEAFIANAKVGKDEDEYPKAKTKTRAAAPKNTDADDDGDIPF